MKTYNVYYAKRLGLHFEAPERVNLDEMDYIGRVEAEDLEDLFRKMNVVDGDELPVTTFKCRSMCSGDIAVDESGQGHFCASIGWATVVLDGTPATLRSV